jgi:Ca-activated chloride channel family protein
VTFDNTPAFVGFFVLIPFVIFETIHYYSRRRTLRALNLLPNALKVRAFFSTVFFTLCIASCIIAFAGPRWGAQSVLEYRRGVDVVFAFDVSRSMEAGDVTPSRFGRSAVLAKEALAALGDVRLGVAIGKGSGVLALPLTSDKNTPMVFIDSLLSESITGGGTNLESIVDAADSAFLDDFPARRIIVLFSDGESLSGSLQAAASRAKLNGTILVTVGLGTEAGAPVPERFDLDPRSGEPILTEAVISYRNSEALRNAADRSGGIYLDGNDDGTGAALAAYIRSHAAETGANTYRLEAKKRWQLFVLAALLFAALAKLMEKKRRYVHT